MAGLRQRSADGNPRSLNTDLGHGFHDLSKLVSAIFDGLSFAVLIFLDLAPSFFRESFLLPRV